MTQSVLRLAESRAPHDANVAAFLRRVRGIVLLGTPNTGSGHANLASFFSKLFRPREKIKYLQRDNAYVRDLNTWFRSFFQKNNLTAIVIREQKNVGMLGVIVKPSNSDPGLTASVSVVPVDEDHLSLSHPMTRESEVYRHIADFLRSPLDGRHADTLIADGLNDLKEIVQDAKSGTEEVLAGQKKVERALERSVTEVPLVTRDANRRLLRLQQIRFAAGFELKKECESLTKAVEDGDLVSAGKAVRQSVFAWCSRILATVDYPAAQVIYEKARELGESTETTVAEAFLRAFATPGDKPAALAMLAALGTPLAYTAALMIQAHNEDPAFPLKWLSDTGLTADALDSDGKLRAIGLQIATRAWLDALKAVESLTDSDFEATPSLLMMSATVYLANAVHEDMREAMLVSLPEPLDSFPLSEDAQAMAYRAKALSLLERATVTFENLGVDKIVAMTQDRALWLALRNPASKAEALKELEASMSTPKTRLRRFPMALAFGLKLDLQAVEREIDAEVALTGGNPRKPQLRGLRWL